MYKSVRQNTFMWCHMLLNNRTQLAADTIARLYTCTVINGCQRGRFLRYIYKYSRSSADPELT